MGSRLLLPLAALAAAGLVLLVMLSGRPHGGPADLPAARAPAPEPEPDAPLPPPAPDEPDDLAAAGTGRIAVLVVREDDRPLPGARVSAGRARAETDSTGRAVLDGLPEGKTLPVRAEGPLETDVAAEAKAKPASGEAPEVRLVIQEGGAASGTVTDEGGAPLGTGFRIGVRRLPDDLPAGVVLPAGMNWGRVEGEKSFPATSAEWTVGGLSPGKYQATATADGWVDGSSEPFTVEKGAVTRDVAIALGRGCAVSGVVVRARTGEPVKEARVTLSPGGRDGTFAISGSSIQIGGGGAGRNFVFAGAYAAQTDDQGRFALNGVKPGTYRLSAGAADLSPGAIDEVVVEAGRDRTGLYVALGEGGSLTGTVFDEAGHPVPAAEVLVQKVDPDQGVVILGDFGRREKANDAGVYLVEHLEPGRYRVKRAAGGGSGAVVAMSFRMTAGGGPKDPEPEEDPTAVTVREGQVTRLDVRSEAVAAIRGRVLDAADQPARERVQLTEVDVDDPDAASGAPRISIPRMAMADAEGRFEFAAIPPGTWKVAAGGDEQEVTVEAGRTCDVTLRVSQAAVEGIVVDDSGHPVEGAQVGLRSIDRSRTGAVMFTGFPGNTRTDGEGRFRIDKVNAGRYAVSAQKGAVRGRPVEIDVLQGQPVRGLRLLVEETSEVTVEVRDRDGRPIAGAFVAARDGEEFAGAGRTDAKGDATLRLLPGTYRIMVNLPSDTPAAGNGAEREIVVGRGGGQRATVRVE